MNIAVIGTGYVGLVTGTCLAETGNTVTCIDIDAEKVKQMQAGQVPIYEPGLEELFARNITEKRLSFTTDLTEGIKDTAIIFLALPTPPGKDGTADLSYVFGVADKLGALLKEYVVVVDKSTVPVGTADEVQARIAKNANVDFDVASNPEFLREGFAIADFMNPDRVIIGSDSMQAQTLLKKIYTPFVQDGGKLLLMDVKSAELTKYASNAFLVTKISFMNEIANVCERLDANVDAVRLGMGSDDRIGPRFLFPGIGYGGSCFPKDVLALHSTAAANDYTFKILDAVTEVNKTQRQKFIKKILLHFDGKLEGKKIAHWGLSFKPDTDDVREAPAIDVIKALTAAGAHITAYDPKAMPNARRLLEGTKNLDFATDQYEALRGADALLITTEWEQFRSPDFARMKSLLTAPIIFDGRNLYAPDSMEQEGFYYNSIGRKIVDGRKK